MMEVQQAVKSAVYDDCSLLRIVSWYFVYWSIHLSVLRFWIVVLLDCNAILILKALYGCWSLLGSPQLWLLTFRSKVLHILLMEIWSICWKIVSPITRTSFSMLSLSNAFPIFREACSVHAEFWMNFRWRTFSWNRTIIILTI